MVMSPDVLQGTFVELQPLAPQHAEGLAACISEEEWRYIPNAFPTSQEDWLAFIDTALTLQAQGLAVPYAVVSKHTNEVVGTTRLMDINAANKGCEIGYTLYAKKVHGSQVNPECKLLLMSKAFEQMGMIRVFLKTDSRNQHSQAAIAKLGAQKEGVLRNHMICADGYRRHSVYYSVLDTEWPTVKQGLVARLAEKQSITG